MTTTRFSPDDVVARCRELAVRPVYGGTNLIIEEGRWSLGQRKESCAMGVMLADRPAVPNDIIPEAMSREFGISYTSFYHGFDDLDPDGLRAEDWWSEEDFELGQRCREAVVRELVL